MFAVFRRPSSQQSRASSRRIPAAQRADRLRRQRCTMLRSALPASSDGTPQQSDVLWRELYGDSGRLRLLPGHLAHHIRFAQERQQSPLPHAGSCSGKPAEHHWQLHPHIRKAWHASHGRRGSRHIHILRAWRVNGNPVHHPLPQAHPALPSVNLPSFPLDRGKKTC